MTLTSKFHVIDWFDWHRIIEIRSSSLTIWRRWRRWRPVERFIWHFPDVDQHRFEKNSQLIGEMKPIRPRWRRWRRRRLGYFLDGNRLNDSVV